ncbi:ATP adenylyltransferase [Planktothrix rubescens CCAP 1459/22]|jgi:ATP adenylyltransferase|uniref:ATP adenylyltransferase n=2 Tax=Microcoleaceae TaxID=1892252 RepID=A0A6J7ZLL4_PLARU|nr:ATP adenylyltransferase [Planktothrix rubescens NIVA-CYA 18]CAD5978622.1 Protein APA1 [Planktothrix rubescens NIVA-CYA 18]
MISTTTANLMLPSGTLWQRIITQTELALNCDALQSIPTEYDFIEAGSIQFLVRILSNLARKQKAKKKQQKKLAKSGKEFNPFLPYEQDLFVGNLSETHLCLLNKFNVVDYHLLIITRQFEEQETWLTQADFEAMWLSLAEIDGLVFYNGGKLAGASQRHKHLQLVPFPLVPDGINLPIEPAIASVQFNNSIGIIPEFPFVHAIATFNPDWINHLSEAAIFTLELYFELLAKVGLSVRDNPFQSGAYNLLATRNWMMIVPRSQEKFEGISINSLGFAGGLLVKNSEQLHALKSYNPLTVLKQVGV